jgi:hypothetical protein
MPAVDAIHFYPQILRKTLRRMPQRFRPSVLVRKRLSLTTGRAVFQRFVRVFPDGRRCEKSLVFLMFFAVFGCSAKKRFLHYESPALTAELRARKGGLVEAIEAGQTARRRRRIEACFRIPRGRQFAPVAARFRSPSANDRLNRSAPQEDGLTSEPWVWYICTYTRHAASFSDWNREACWQTVVTVQDRHWEMREIGKVEWFQKPAAEFRNSGLLCGKQGERAYFRNGGGGPQKQRSEIPKFAEQAGYQAERF